MPASHKPEELLPHFLETVVEVATKSAEASTSVATAVRNLEARVEAAVGAARAASTAAEAAKVEASAAKEKIASLENVLKLRSGGTGVSAFVEAFKNPQTVIIILWILAGLLGIRMAAPPTSLMQLTSEVEK